MQLFEVAILAIGGLVAGLIDSIAGGGGLITLPLLHIFLPSGVAAIGSNKIVGLTGALVALIVYARAGHLRFKAGLPYVLCVGTGSFIGSLITPHLEPASLSRVIVFACSAIGIMLVTKSWWWPTEARRAERKKRSIWLMYCVSLLVGCYDGAIGPGGGTFMLLVLLLLSPFALLESLALSKMANTMSAAVSLVSYALQGHVVIVYGLLVALGVSFGAWIGAGIALKNADKLIRPALLLIVSLLLWRLWLQTR